MTRTPQPSQESNWQAQARIGSYAPPGDRATGWAAGLIFAAVMLVMVGLFAVMQGLTALLNEDFYALNPSGLVVTADYTVWGWVHLVLGLVAIVTGWGLQRGAATARVAGVVIAALSIVGNLTFLPAYPWWLVPVIAFDVLVIYAITVHGQEGRAAR